MAPFVKDIESFLASRKTASDQARQKAAFFLACGVDLEEALGSKPEQKRKIILRLERMIERERLKGHCHHWSYDLNRHIALKQAVDRLRRGEDCVEETKNVTPGWSEGTVRRIRRAAEAKSGAKAPLFKKGCGQSLPAPEQRA